MTLYHFPKLIFHYYTLRQMCGFLRAKRPPFSKIDRRPKARYHS